MFKKATVVPLTTNQKVKIGDWSIIKLPNGKLAQGIKVQETFNVDEINIHLYIISDEEIKEGDWCLFFWDGGQLGSDAPKQHDSSKEHVLNSGLRKVIATTDTSLKIKTYYEIEGDQLLSLSQPSQSFIDKYITEYNKGNMITDVLVEYKETWEGVPGYPKAFKDAKMEDAILRLKINPKDNTITIKRIKDSWTREEVIQLIRDFDISLDKNDGYGGSNYRAVWIKNNL